MNPPMKAPELLAPAGNLRNLRYAIAYGADAVYAGMPRYSLRVRNNDFSHIETLAAGIELVHAHGKAFFLATNVLPHNSKVKTFLADMAPVIALQPDALIMADPGLIMLVREHWPDLPVHLSVQANTMNTAGVKFWQQAGVRRMILSRELSLDQVAEIRQDCPDVELEVFVHGALCIAYSGRCLLSGYFNHRDANQGTCTNACRWEYKLKGPGERYLLEETSRPGELMPIEEDEHGTYIMNSKDLRAVEHVARLIDMGIDSLKIEGRTKSHYYTARTTQVYRQAIDDAIAGRPFDAGLLGKLENLASRGYTDGFFQRHHAAQTQNYLDNHSMSHQQRFVGEVLGYDAATGLVEVEVKNHFEVGDELELVLPDGNRSFRLESLWDRQGTSITVAPGSGHRVRLPVPVEANTLGLLAVNLTARDTKPTGSCS